MQLNKIRTLGNNLISIFLIVLSQIIYIMMIGFLLVYFSGTTKMAQRDEISAGEIALNC